MRLASHQYNNHIRVVKELLKCDDIEIDHSDISGSTVLYWACKQGNVEIVVELIRHSADANKSNMNLLSPLQIACDNNLNKIVRELLNCDTIDIDHSNNSDCTAIYLASQVGNVEIVKYLISHSVDINNRNESGLSPLQAATFYNHIEVVKELLKCDYIDCNHSDDTGCTALYLA